MLREIEIEERQALERLVAGAAPAAFLRTVRWRWAGFDPDYASGEEELGFITNHRKTLNAVSVALQGAGYAVRVERAHYQASWQEWGPGDVLVLTGLALPAEVTLEEWVRDA